MAIRDPLDPREDVAIRYLEQNAPIESAAAIRLTASIVGDAPCIVHRGAGLLDEPLARFITHLRNAPDALLIVQASGPAEHLSPATQNVLHVAAFNAERALGCRESGRSARARCRSSARHRG